MHYTNRKYCYRKSFELLWFSEIVAALWENKGLSMSQHKTFVNWLELSTLEISAPSQAIIDFFTFFAKMRNLIKVIVQGIFL